jgi:hypothetical protein
MKRRVHKKGKANMSPSDLLWWECPLQTANRGYRIDVQELLIQVNKRTTTFTAASSRMPRRTKWTPVLLQVLGCDLLLGRPIAVSSESVGTHR